MAEADILLEADIEFCNMLKMFFVKNYQNLFNDIQKSIDTGEIEAAYRLVHSLKSNSAQIGKTNLQKAAADVEALLKNGQNNVTEPLLKNLKMELNAVLNELSSLLNEEQ